MSGLYVYRVISGPEYSGGVGFIRLRVLPAGEGLEGDVPFVCSSGDILTPVRQIVVFDDVEYRLLMVTPSFERYPIRWWELRLGRVF